ncbi:hypothetical protein Mp_8g18150 [Marchantia polymorpha subsp. ruderalis]|nr:hypothetical protein MARPO_0030s0148 [Marchantia polymorpha]BBN20316.1 hypothetical protein Mp_8g18150 [Marchantia polymorpha subsp. ruderalis]|eukprot:PTQ42436.1 hypothetical protein MARPO_0030s0148 [Marchantia polymorpha]
MTSTAAVGQNGGICCVAVVRRKARKEAGALAGGGAAAVNGGRFGISRSGQSRAVGEARQGHTDAERAREREGGSGGSGRGGEGVELLGGKGWCEKKRRTRRWRTRRSIMRR